jgi:hypothetical protein
VRKIVVGGIATAMGVTVGLAPWASAGGNGAARSGLSPQAGNNTDQCVEGSGAANNGFVMLNAPGKPGDANKLLGEVSLKNGPPDTTYNIFVAVADGSDKCLPDGSLTTNGQGNGNGHIADMNQLKNGTYYVVLQDAMMQEQFASGQLVVN